MRLHAPGRRPEARSGVLQVRRQALQADRGGAHRERQADRHVSAQQRRQPDGVAQADILKQLQQAGAGHQRRQQQRPERQCEQRRATAKVVPHQREGQRQCEQGGAGARRQPELQAEQQRVDPLPRKRAAPPLQGKSARREERAVRRVEGHCRRDQDRPQHEGIDRHDDDAQRDPCAACRLTASHRASHGATHNATWRVPSRDAR